MNEDQFAELCDALCRILWADRYGIEPYGAPNDGICHTSDEARRLALIVMDAMEEE
jgi:hypothetical protein